MKLLFSSALLAALAILSGCGGTQCEQTCTQYNACPVSQRSIDVDCGDFCSQVDSLNVRANTAGVTGCAALWTTHLQCWASKANTQVDFADPISGKTIKIPAICDSSFVDCDQSATDWQDCVVPFCDQVVNAGNFDRACQGDFEGFPNNLSLWSPFQSGF